ncbi:MAG: hypothetical protein MUC60_18890 [Oscillatoria sp. Prado101]|jgi:hypothetical protein|nr:hypothetical protein [Oscillatoria sp. Prado101]
MTSGKSFNCLRQAALITVIAAVLFSVSPVLGLAFALGIVYRLLLAKPVAAAALPVPPAPLRELVIEIDAAKRERQVAEITETEDFQRLLRQAKQLRRNRER